MTHSPIIMTLMVRDEADVIAAMIEHHLAQGIDRIIVTDNGSVDGTREILAEYAAVTDRVEVCDDPRHEKQQAEVVTVMARRAFTDYGAGWVINADADEFWFADSGVTVAEALRATPASVQSFNVPVQNMFGAPLESGSALRNHIWRDERNLEELFRIGLHDHPTPDCVHRGNAEIEVAQGNHFTNLPLTDSPSVPESSRLTVLHFPYRNWNQYRHRVEVTAASYRVSGKKPSPRHHGMRDADWLQKGILLPFFVARHPVLSASEQPQGFARDMRVRDALESLLTDGAVLPKRLTGAMREPKPLPEAQHEHEQFELIGPLAVEAAEKTARLQYRTTEFYEELQRRENAENELTNQAQQLATAKVQLEALNTTIEDQNAYIARFSSHPVTKAAMLIFTPVKGQRQRVLDKLPDPVKSVLRRLRRILP